MMFRDLSDEQKMFVDYAVQGYSIHVEACIGSGKTTAIQMLCECLPASKRILYLTYNKLLKEDAKARIRGANVDVTNYHGFAYREMVTHGVATTQQDCVRDYNARKPEPRHYDVMMIDEYQDIDQEIADMLTHLKNSLPGIQIIVVGDMAQKIYDKTRLHVGRFMAEFMPANTVKLEFTQCFRLPAGLASHLGHVWGKTIVGVNTNCQVEHMGFTQAMSVLLEHNPGDILCLGSNTGFRVTMLNRLEQEAPDRFNKNTCWSNITSREGGATTPGPGTAIFTTYDGCKGMERDVCVVFDWTEDYWYTRNHKPEANYEILRNLFCVAASRGKRRIIFVTGSHVSLKWRSLMEPPCDGVDFQDMTISTMFDFKFEEDVDDAYEELEQREIVPAGEEISVRNKDGLIDLSPCIGTYQEAMFFRGYDIDEAVRFYFDQNKDQEYKEKTIKEMSAWSLEQKILYLTSLETNQHRYWYQVSLPLVPDAMKGQIKARLSEVFTGDEDVQGRCYLPVCGAAGFLIFMAAGQYDVCVDDTIYELKFVSELAHVHYLQCAMYMVAMNKPRGVLFNVRTGQQVEIRIPDRQRFMNKAIKAATKSAIKEFNIPAVGEHISLPDGWYAQFPERNDKALTAPVENTPAPWSEVALPEPGSEFSAVMKPVQKLMKKPVTKPAEKPQAKKKPFKRRLAKAKDYPCIVNEFLMEHQDVTSDVMDAVDKMRKAGKKPNPYQLEDMFSLRGVELPLPCMPFSICFWEVYNKMSTGV